MAKIGAMMERLKTLRDDNFDAHTVMINLATMRRLMRGYGFCHSALYCDQEWVGVWRLDQD